MRCCNTCNQTKQRKVLICSIYKHVCFEKGTLKVDPSIHDDCQITQARKQSQAH